MFEYPSSSGSNFGISGTIPGRPKIPGSLKPSKC